MLRQYGKHGVRQRQPRLIARRSTSPRRCRLPVGGGSGSGPRHCISIGEEGPRATATSRTMTGPGRRTAALRYLFECGPQPRCVDSGRTVSIAPACSSMFARGSTDQRDGYGRLLVISRPLRPVYSAASPPTRSSECKQGIDRPVHNRRSTGHSFPTCHILLGGQHVARA